MTKKLIITGASKGIGHETAQFFLSKNYAVLNISRTACQIKGIKNISCDLSSSRNVWEIRKEISEFVENNRTKKA